MTFLSNACLYRLGEMLQISKLYGKVCGKKPDIRHVIRNGRFDERRHPDAGFTDVRTESYLELNSGSFELNPGYKFFFSIL